MIIRTSYGHSHSEIDSVLTRFVSRYHSECKRNRQIKTQEFICSKEKYKANAFRINSFLFNSQETISFSRNPSLDDIIGSPRSFARLGVHFE
jgi:hypothetical protein